MSHPVNVTRVNFHAGFESAVHNICSALLER